MRVTQRVDELARDVGDFLDPELALVALVRLDPLAQVVALQPLHREVVVVAALTDVVHAHDVRMRQVAGNFGLRKEALLRSSAEQQILTQHLDRDVFVLQAIACGIHVAHAALSEQCTDLQPARQHSAGLHAHQRFHVWRVLGDLSAGAHHGRRGFVGSDLRVAAGLRDELVGFDELRELRLAVHAVHVGLRFDQLVLDDGQPLAVHARYGRRVFFAR